MSCSPGSIRTLIGAAVGRPGYRAEEWLRRDLPPQTPVCPLASALLTDRSIVIRAINSAGAKSGSRSVRLPAPTRRATSGFEADTGRHPHGGAQATVFAMLLSARLNISGVVSFGQNVCLMNGLPRRSGPASTVAAPPLS